MSFDKTTPTPSLQWFSHFAIYNISITCNWQDGMSPISFLADDMRSQTDDQHSESSELASESSDQVTEMTRVCFTYLSLLL